MELTEVQKLLIACLKRFGVSKGRSMVVCLLLKEEEQQMDMIEYLLNEPDMTDEKALNTAQRIAAG